MDFLKFQMIDRVIGIDKENRSIVCQTTLPESSFIFDAHFPGFPVLPGVFMIETIAQATGLLSLVLTDFKKMAFLFGVEETRFRDFVSPGSVLDIEVKILQQGSGYVVAAGEITHQDKRVAHVQVRLHLAALPNKEVEQLLFSRAVSIGLQQESENAVPV